MYNYEIKDNQILVTKEDKQVCHADIIVEDDRALIDNIYMDKFDVTSPIAFLSTLCQKAKSLLNEKGNIISTAYCGNIIEIAEYDRFLATLDTNERLNESTIVKGMR